MSNLVATVLVASVAVASAIAPVNPNVHQPRRPEPDATVQSVADASSAKRVVGPTRKQTDAERRQKQVYGACSSRWKTDLEEGNDRDCYGRVTGSGDGKVRCAGGCAKLVPPQDVASCVIDDRGRILSIREAEVRGVTNRVVRCCTDCRMKAPPERQKTVSILGMPDVPRIPLERMPPPLRGESGRFSGRGKALAKTGPEYSGSPWAVVEIEEPIVGEEGYDGSSITEALAGLRALGRPVLTAPAAPTGGTPKPKLELLPGMSPADRAEAINDYQREMEAFRAEERSLEKALAAVRLAAPDGLPPRLNLAGVRTNAELQAATVEHEKQMAAYKLAIATFEEVTREGRSRSEQSWRRSRTREAATLDDGRGEA